MERVILIDGPSLLHRAYHALPPLTDPKGEPVGAVFGFTSMFLKVLEDLKPTLIACAWDTAAPTFRDQLFTQYKAQRPKLENDFLTQEPKAHQVLETFGIRQYAIDGFEADDIIGTIASEFKVQSAKFKVTVQSSKLDGLNKSEDAEVIIVTGDMDSTQLIDEHTKVYTSRKGFSDTVMMGEKEVMERFGLKPDQIVDYKALRGDPSDNIPGVRGIGEKTASELLQKLGSLQGVYEHLGDISERQRKLLVDSQEMAFLSQKLATIDQKVPLQVDWGVMRFGEFGKNKVLSLFQEFGFRSLVGRFEKIYGLSFTSASYSVPGLGFDLQKQSVKEDKSFAVSNQSLLRIMSLEDVLRLAQEKKELVLDTETTGFDPFHGEIVGIGLGVDQSFCFLARTEFLGNLNLIKAILEDPSISKIGHNLKFDAQFLLNYGIKVSPLAFDTIIAAYLLQAGQGRLGLKDLAFSKLGMVMEDIKEVSSKFKVQSSKLTEEKESDSLRNEGDNIWQGTPIEEIGRYCLNDVKATDLLYMNYQKEFLSEERLERIFEEVEMPLSEILLEMEREGVMIDNDFLGRTDKQLTEEIARREREVFSAVGHEFNLNSPKQLDQILFDELHLPDFGKTKGKTHRSTDESVLRKLKNLHPAIIPLLEYREAFKIKTTYIDALRELQDKAGRVHTKFNQTRTSTGRLSSEDPNLQNIPVSGQWSLRQAFVVPKGYKLLVADYSQIELRIMAHFSGDSALINSFEHDQDIHTATAARIFNKYINEVTPDERRIGKTVNFSVLYGQTAYGLSELLSIEQSQAQHFIDEYFESYPGVNVWISENLQKAYETGYVETILGRKRLVPEIKTSSFFVRSAGERMAVNMPIQGTAADLIKLAMVNISAKFKVQSSKFKGVKMLLQVHDELVFEVPEDQVGEIGPMVKEEMERAMELRVPIKVGLKTGRNWGELEAVNVK